MLRVLMHMLTGCIYPLQSTYLRSGSMLWRASVDASHHYMHTPTVVGLGGMLCTHAESADAHAHSVP
jgi:hypothetical protein